MSYSILYRSMFVKLSNGKYIPMMEMGDNNVYEPSWGQGRARRARSWHNINLNKGQKFFTIEEVKSGLDDWFKSVSESYKDSNVTDSEFGYYGGIAVFGKGGCSGTSFKDVRNIVFRGIKKAISIEQAINECGLRIRYWDGFKQKHLKFQSEEEMYEVIKANFGDAKHFYFSFVVVGDELYKSKRA